MNKETGLTLIELAEDVKIEELLTATAADFAVSPDLKKMGQIPISN